MLKKKNEALLNFLRNFNKTFNKLNFKIIKKVESRTHLKKRGMIKQKKIL
jgi:hypothetical protein